MPSNIASRLTALQAKVVEHKVTEVKVPDAIADPLELFEQNSGKKTDSANTWTVDVFPSQQTIFMFLCSLAVSASSAADHKNHAKSSAFTFCAYYFTVYHAIFLLNDLHIRPSPSIHARVWQESSWRAKFAEYLLSLPVPDHMHTIFAQLSATCTERTANVFFVPSAAGFRHDIFFGRFFPVNMFTMLHDIAATFPGNTPRETIYNEVLKTVLYTITPTTGSTYFARISNLLGVFPGATAELPRSRIMQVFSKLFNPVLFRDFHRRSSLATTDISVVKFKSDHFHLNAYDCLFSATAPNLRELMVVLDALKPIIGSTTKCSKNIGQLISSASGIEILSHGYSDFAQPTWISNKRNAATAPTWTTVTATKPIDLADAANKLTFLTHPTRPTAAQDIIPYRATKADGSPLPNDTSYHNTWPWTLVLRTAPATPHPKMTKMVTYDEDRSPNPHVLVLDINGNATSVHLATLTHKIIETFEIAGTVIEHPRTDKSLGMQNCIFASSAVPYQHVIRGTSFTVRTTGLPLPQARSAPNSTTRLDASSLLHDHTKFMLPQISPKVIDTVTTGAGNIASIPGTIRAQPTDWLRYAQSFLGFKTKSKSSDNDQIDVPNMEYGRIYLFSPYSYTSYEDEDQDAALPNLNESQHYFLTNLRSLFGTDYNLVEVNHPFEAMPVL